MKYIYTPEQKERMMSNPWLTDRQRDIFEMVYRRGWNIQDVANELEISYRTVSSELQKIRNISP